MIAYTAWMHVNLCFEITIIVAKRVCHGRLKDRGYIANGEIGVVVGDAFKEQVAAGMDKCSVLLPSLILLTASAAGISARKGLLFLNWPMR